MVVHYSQPKGFVGRSICYAILYDNKYYGAIIGGSSSLHLPGRDEFFSITPSTKRTLLRSIINNIFFHVEKCGDFYPTRNFVPKILKTFRKQIAPDWQKKYGDPVIGFETLVEPPRTGEAYLRDGWQQLGVTKGFTCKRGSALGQKKTDSWGGQRVWDRINLRPKLVFARYMEDTMKKEKTEDKLEEKQVRKEKPKDLLWSPDNNWGAGHWEDYDGNTWVERKDGWENWGRMD